MMPLDLCNTLAGDPHVIYPIKTLGHSFLNFSLSETCCSSPMKKLCWAKNTMESMFLFHSISNVDHFEQITLGKEHAQVLWLLSLDCPELLCYFWASPASVCSSSWEADPTPWSWSFVCRAQGMSAGLCPWGSPYLASGWGGL